MAQYDPIKIQVFARLPRTADFAFVGLAVLAGLVFAPLFQGTIAEELVESAPIWGGMAVLAWRCIGTVPAGAAVVVGREHLFLPGCIRRCGEDIEISRIDVASVSKRLLRGKNGTHTTSLCISLQSGEALSCPALLVDSEKLAEALAEAWGIDCSESRSPLERRGMVVMYAAAVLSLVLAAVLLGFV